MPEKPVRAIIIDPRSERISEQVVLPTDAGLSKVIGCQLVQLRVPVNDHVAYTNADVLPPLEERHFVYNDILFSGRMVIVSCDLYTHLDCTLSVEEVGSKVQWAYPVLARDGIRFAVEA
ncbi:hypothetical protein A6A05_16215 [Magnetospirillum moscoviense]|uniref:Uncharacterized protein n=2 Tax=Magnetospirillum moscoviense TaxID=1437059 RepID=A0A178MC12_9PROT|nr:hypothetical protein A6A05_16215 [Magnetospirillum moscoviense]